MSEKIVKIQNYGFFVGRVRLNKKVNDLRSVTRHKECVLLRDCSTEAFLIHKNIPAGVSPNI